MRWSIALESILSVHGETLLSFKKKKPYLHKVIFNKGKNGNFIVITHEQWVLTSSLGLDSLELKLVQFSGILELWIIIYELITNYPRLIIKLELIIK
jgi:hypothetical protein